LRGRGKLAALTARPPPLIRSGKGAWRFAEINGGSAGEHKKPHHGEARGAGS